MQAPEARRTSVDYVEQPCKSALNAVRGMPFKWSLNPYMGCEHRCTFCYVRAFEKRAERPSDDRYGRTIRVKVNIAQVLRAELGRRRWAGETVVIGAATDPYQPAEGTFRLTRACLETLADRANPAGIITRGPMIVRDIDVLTQLARRAELGVTISVPTLDEAVWRRTEPGTPHPRRRLEALSRLVAAGIRVNVAMAPILPGLSDRPDQLELVVAAARAAGACGIWANLLYLRPGTREHFLESLAKHWPELLPLYEHEYRLGAYLTEERTRPLQQTVAALRARHQVADRRSAPLVPPERPLQLELISV